MPEALWKVKSTRALRLLIKFLNLSEPFSFVETLTLRTSED